MFRGWEKGVGEKQGVCREEGERCETVAFRGSRLRDEGIFGRAFPALASDLKMYSRINNSSELSM
jgi:hypothetical protein